MRESGKVYLVGAGPGDPGLLTLRGADCLRQADVVLYDYLANPRLLEHAPRGAERVCLGRHGHEPILPSREVCERMVREARAGRTVVRLKGGDPTVFARASEEIEALTTAGIPFEIVPGITAALAASSYAGIPLTDRDMASAIALVTARQKDATGATEPSEPLDYRALAAFPGTLVFYMGVTNAAEWTQALIRAGKPPETPAAVVRRCSWPDQVVIRSTLEKVADEMASRRLRPPVIVLVGAVAGMGQVGSWFERRPLAGRRVLVTRPAEQAADVREGLERLGAQVILQPAIEIAAPPDPSAVDDALARIHDFDWIVFLSANGVRWFMRRLLELGGDARRMGRASLAAMGSGTAAALDEFHLRPDLVPREHRSESLAQSFEGQAEGKRFLIARADRGREVLPEDLRRAGAIVEEIAVYQSRDVAEPDPAVRQALVSGRINWILVTSSAIAGTLIRWFDGDLRQARLASLSPLTSAALVEAGQVPAVEALPHTLDAMMEAIVLYEERIERSGQKEPTGH
jgi:uroporphyrinogen III methyltransferase/synthase